MIDRGCRSTRRQMLAASATGTVALAAGVSSLHSNSNEQEDASNASQTGALSIVSRQIVPAGSTFDLQLRYIPKLELKAGAKLWFFYDIRQDAEVGQIADASAKNFVVVRAGASDRDAVRIEPPSRPRTFDLYPAVPEFLYLIEMTIKQTLAGGTPIDIVIRRWTGPQRPIDPFRFWLVVDHQAAWDFVPIGFRGYRKFVRRGSEQRIEFKSLLDQTLSASMVVTGNYPAIAAVNHRETPGVYWGELHGMAFNQRPLDDFYEYAKNVTKLDFCSACLFSYNTCVGDVWQQVKDAATRHAVPGQFVPIVGFECGTPEDGSHRKAHFRDPEKVPPIFCEDRPPAREAFFQQRLHPDTIICKTVQDLYRAVKRFGGMVSGHHHTLTYHAEHLAEMWQKQVPRGNEEERIYGLMRQGKRFGLVAGSDTHDSMPGNPAPEPSCSRPAGFTGVWAEKLTLDALWKAIIARRVFATSGARILMKFLSENEPMGSERALHSDRRFQIEIDGTDTLKSVELLRDGRSITQWSPNGSTFASRFEDRKADRSKPAFYLVRVLQQNGHRGWTSPIWFG